MIRSYKVFIPKDFYMNHPIINFVLAAVLGIILGSCTEPEEEEESLHANVSIHARAVAQNETVGPGNVNIAGASFRDFHIGLREVGLLKKGESVQDKTPIGNQEPMFLKFLLSQLSQLEYFGSSMIRKGEFDRVSFMLNRGSELPLDHPMHNKTLLMTGTVNGTRLRIYSTAEKEITVRLFRGPYSIQHATDLFLNLDLNTLLHRVDLTTAQDGNGDGIIEIEPTNKDGNSDLYNAIFNNIENAILINRE